ncbi:hypothetical protein EK21DRAFT_90138 [Setomelanomma holmii]|uniref:Uncharacterized protein n=1 Tax=Setomelanomma holmii TaxID=210430 RepID=A0A9P4H6H8_9PLEO|nr:hypothetical protein EK21DRAFT_90138 [Setomelanomma holmii]
MGLKALDLRSVTVKAEGSRVFWDLRDIDSWIPQFAALCQPYVASSHDSLSTHHSSTTLDHSVFTQAAQQESSCFREAVESSNLHEVHIEQAAAFSLAVQYLSLGALGDCPYDLIRSMPFIETNTADLGGISGDEQNKLVAMRHTLANRIVGFVAAGMRFASGLTHPRPPIATTIPFTQHMNLPLPFTPNGTEAFSKWHLPAMSEPKFFTDSIWTG